MTTYAQRLYFIAGKAIDRAVEESSARDFFASEPGYSDRFALNCERRARAWHLFASRIEHKLAAHLRQGCTCSEAQLHQVGCDCSDRRRAD